MKISRVHYIAARITSIFIDLIVAIPLAFFLTALWQLPACVDSFFEVERIEAESLNAQNYVPQSHSEASSGTMMITAERGFLKGQFPFETGNYDIVICYFDKKVSDRLGRLDIRIGDNEKHLELGLEEGALVRSLIFRDITIEKGDEIFLSGLSTGNEFASIDYIDAINSESAAFRPRGSERAYRLAPLPRAIGYDDLNVHISLLKLPMALLFLQGLSFLLFQRTPGMFVVGLELVTRENISGLRLVLLRTLGNVVGVFFLGLGILHFLFSRYRQTWADIYSGSFLIPVQSAHVDVFRKKPKGSIFYRAKRGLGWFEQVPVSLRFAGLVFDCWLYTVLFLVVFMLQKKLQEAYTRGAYRKYEIEDMALEGFRYTPSIWASDFGTVTAVLAPHNTAQGIFDGPDGSYDVVLGVRKLRMGHFLKFIHGGHKRELVGFTYAHQTLKGQKTVLLSSGERMATGESFVIDLKSEARSYLDYIEFIPVGEAIPYYWEKPVNWKDPYLEVFGINSYDLQGVLLALLLTYVFGYILFIGSLGQTPGMFLVGIRACKLSNSTKSPGFRSAFARLVLLIVSPIFVLHYLQARQGRGNAIDYSSDTHLQFLHLIN